MDTRFYKILRIFLEKKRYLPHFLEKRSKIHYVQYCCRYYSVHYPSKAPQYCSSGAKKHRNKHHEVLHWQSSRFRSCAHDRASFKSGSHLLSFPTERRHLQRRYSRLQGSSLYVPYGPDLTSSPPQATDDQPWTGYGYGLGATEHYAYDAVEQYLYSQSEAGGYITVLDYSSLPGTVTDFSIDVGGGPNVDIKDVVVCGAKGYLMVTVIDQNEVLLYNTVKRDAPSIPVLQRRIEAGNAPDAMKFSNDCSVLAVANQNEGETLLTEGALTLITNLDQPAAVVTQTVRLNNFDDTYLLGRGVNMPISQNAMRYWSRQNSDLASWQNPGGLIDLYNPAIAMDPEFLAFNEDGTELFLNLQKNSALARIDTATGTVTSITGYGAKPMTSGTDGVDIVDDGECKLITDDCLYLNRNPDGIATVQWEGVDYILTAEEGSDFDLGDYEEKMDTNDVFLAGGSLALENMTLSPEVEACRAHFAEDCAEDWCSNFEITMGTLAVDYSTPSAPVLNRIVGFGGRGMGIYKLDSNPEGGMELVFDSNSMYEQETCAKFPWAHNSVMDEEFAPVRGALWQLIEDDREGIEEL